MSGANKKGVEFVKYVMQSLAKAKGFDRTMDKLKVIDGGDGCCTAEFTVEEEHLNRGGSLHGGCTSMLVDMVTTYALSSKIQKSGLSVDMHVTFMKAAREGDEVIVDANTVRAGRKLAFIECELRHKKDGSIIARGTHTKFVG